MSNTAILLRSELETDDWIQVERVPHPFQAKEVMMLGMFLILLQAADGVLTMMGVQQFGTAMEGNILLRTLMNHFGPMEALAVSKILCIAVIIRLTTMAKQFAWVKQAMGAMCCFYLLAAVVPWTYILVTH